MRFSASPFCLVLALLLCVLAHPAAAQSDITLDAQAMRTHAQKLTSLPHRLSGSTTGQAAGDAILESLKQAGIDDSWVLIQPFPVVNAYQPDEGSATIKAGSTTITLQPLRANGLMPAATSDQGITAQLVNVGNCDWPAMTQVVRGNIALVSAGAGNQWRRLIDLSPAAIIFETPDDKHPPRWLDVLVDLPRFEVSSQDMATLAGLSQGNQAQATVTSPMAYRKSIGRNIIVTIPGRSDSRHPENESILLTTSYDTFGDTPFAARRYQQAANVAGLIEAARWFKANPPARPITLVFFDNHAQAQNGQVWFQWARFARNKQISALLGDRLSDLEWTREVLKALANPGDVVNSNPSSAVARQAQKIILQQAELMASQTVSELSAARLMLASFERNSQLTPELLAKSSEHQELKRLVDHYDAQRTSVLHGRRLIASGNLGDGGQMHPFVQELFEVCSDQFKRRESELLTEIRWMEQARNVAQQLESFRFVMTAYLDIPLADSATIVTVPSSEVTGYVVNQQAGRELQNLINKLSPADHRADLAIQMHTVSAVHTPVAATGALSWAITLGQHGLTTKDADLWTPRFPERFAQGLALVSELVDSPTLTNVRIPNFSPTLLFNIPSKVENGRYDGSLARLYDEQTKLGKMAADAVIMIQNRQANSALHPASGSLPFVLTTSDQTGAFWIMSHLHGAPNVRLAAAMFNRQGQVERLSQYTPGGARGTTGSWESAGWYIGRDAIQIPLFSVRRHGIVTHLATLGQVLPASQIKLLNGRSDTAMRELHADSDNDIFAFYTGRTSSFKITALPFLAINNDAKTPLGSGYPTDGTPVDALAATARDLWQLNESRLDRLRRHGIDLPWIEQQHTMAQSLLDKASDTKEADDRQASLAVSAAYSHRAYQPIRDVTNDLINSVVVLLLLAVPFAYATERLIGGSGDVFRQIIGFSVIFLITFGILFWVHPAFRFAGYPLIVLLAFLIIIMSALVIWIMWSKFEYEMRRFHGVATASHQNTRDARATVSAAIAQGIATMKRRPLRTALTMATIAILTFTVLFFGAFSAEPSVRWINVGINTQPTMVVARPAPAAPWRDGMLETLQLRWADQARMYNRVWGVSATSSPWTGRTPDQKLLTSLAWIGVPPQDLELIPQLRQAIQGDIQAFATQGGLLLPGPINPVWIGQTCQFMGRDYVIRGSFDAQALMQLRLVDGASILALDLAEMRVRLTREFPNDNNAVEQRLSTMDASEFPVIEASSSVLISTVDGNIPPNQNQALVILPTHEDTAASIATELAVLMDRAIFTNVNGRAQRAVFHSELQLGGLWAIAIPLLLGALLVFSSMMSSVADRQREIFTFSALGLAPRHIVLLFFAEATVYGLVGAMGGYLGAQIFAKFADAMGRLGLFEPPPLNYSSTNAVLTLVVVIAAVLISTIYPALKASRSANPGIQRAWRMPAPVGDQLDLEFPFTVSHDDMTGLIVYLHEFFLQHTDRSIGGFAAQDVRISRTPQGSHRLHANVWLTPFDQGVSQAFELRTEPSDIEGIDRVLLSMTRTDGSPVMWARGNKLFVADLREQFLLWRTLSDDTIDHYHAQGQKLFVTSSASPAMA